MKKLSHLVILLFLLCQNSKAQTDIQNDTRIAPLLKQAASGQPGLIISGRKDASTYVNMAVLDKDRKKLIWFTCYGSAFDSAQLTDIEYNYITTKAITPFDFYRQFCLENIAYLEDAESHFRQFGKAALKDTVYNRQVVYNAPPVKSAANTLQKVLAMENLLKKQCLQLAMFNSKSPSHVHRSDSFLLRKSLAGKMVRKGDTTTYYNTYLLGSAAQIVINKRSPGKMFIYNRQEQVIDSVPLKPEKYASLLKEKEDVFLLYRGWLELQSQQVLDVRRQIGDLLNRGDTGLYTKINLPEGRQQLQRSMLQLAEQQQTIEVKIGNLLMPDQEVVKSMLQDTYPDAPSEVSYLGSLGFAYTITYTRGRKEYELTDHRGNVMATVSDKKKGIDVNQDGIIEYYNADVVNASDYYSFGSLMPGRTYHAGDKYRYGFNGKENDNEVKGEGNQQDYGMRVYDPRIGRFLSIDPLIKQYPELTPYQFASNRPIDAVDIDGMEAGYWDPNTKTWSMPSDAIRHPIPSGAYVPSIETAKGGIAYRNSIRSLAVEAGVVTAIVTAPYIATLASRGLISMALWASRPQNQMLLAEGATFTAGLLNPGPEDISPNSSTDELARTVKGAIGGILRDLAIAKRTKELSGAMDFAKGQLGRWSESQAGAIIESVFGSLRRTTKDEAGDFIFTSGALRGKTLDHLGVPPEAIGKFSMKEFLKSVDAHFRKSVDYLILDTRGFNKEQTQEVMDYINKSHSNDLDRLMTIENVQ